MSVPLFFASIIKHKKEENHHKKQKTDTDKALEMKTPFSVFLKLFKSLNPSVKPYHTFIANAVR